MSDDHQRWANPLVNLVRLQTDNNFRLFLCQQTDNYHFLFARWTNGKQIKENCAGFRFPFDFYVKRQNSMSMCACVHVSMSPCLHFSMFSCSMSMFPYSPVSISMSPGLNVSMSMSMSSCSRIPQTKNETNRKRQLPFVCCKRKMERQIPFVCCERKWKTKFCFHCWANDTR